MSQKVIIMDKASSRELQLQLGRHFNLIVGIAVLACAIAYFLNPEAGRTATAGMIPLLLSVWTYQNFDGLGLRYGQLNDAQKRRVHSGMAGLVIALVIFAAGVPELYTGASTVPQ